MSTTVTAPPPLTSTPGLGEAPPSPAGPVDGTYPLLMPPARQMPAWVQTIRMSVRPRAQALEAHARFGDVWQIRLLARDEPFVVTCHPDHFRSLMKADPADAPSLTGESPLRPIVGPDSILTSVGERHLRQRKLLLPPFHGEAVRRYVEMIGEITEREIESWPLNERFALAPRMQAITLEVIMRGVFGLEARPAPGSAEDQMRRTIRRLLHASTTPLFALVELRNVSRREATGVLRRMLDTIDGPLHELIAARRATSNQQDAMQRTDVLSLLLRAQDENGAPLTDRELRDELLSLLLAGHETTANSLAWIFERLLRTPAAYERLRELVRDRDEAGAGYVEATIHEGMRNRPVIPMIVRLVKRPWRLGEYVVGAGTPVAVSLVALHHRDDLYPDPLRFWPERFEGRKPGTNTWLPFGGGIRRCLGAALAMAEQRVVLTAIAHRTDMQAPDPTPERARQRNVTTIPSRGTRVIVTHRYPA